MQKLWKFQLQLNNFATVVLKSVVHEHLVYYWTVSRAGTLNNLGLLSAKPWFWGRNLVFFKINQGRFGSQKAKWRTELAFSQQPILGYLKKVVSWYGRNVFAFANIGVLKKWVTTCKTKEISFIKWTITVKISFQGFLGLRVSFLLWLITARTSGLYLGLEGTFHKFSKNF